MNHPQLRLWLVPAIVVGALALCGPAPAQEPRPEDEPSTAPAPPRAATKAASPSRGTQPGDEQKVFVIEHVDPGNLAELLRVFPAYIRSVRRGGLNALAVSAKPAVLAAIEGTIKRLDQPSSEPKRPTSNVELTVFILGGLAESNAAEALPPELAGVVAQLRQMFRFPAYRLLDTVVARSRVGSQFRAEGVAQKGGLPFARPLYRLRGYAAVRSDGEHRIVQLDRFEFSLQVPVPTGPLTSDPPDANSFQYREAGLSSDIDVREGQYVVVGKSGSGGSDDALVLVLTAKVVD